MPPTRPLEGTGPATTSVVRNVPLAKLRTLLSDLAGHFLAVHISCQRPSNVHPTATDHAERTAVRVGYAVSWLISLRAALASVDRSLPTGPGANPVGLMAPRSA